MTEIKEISIFLKSFIEDFFKWASHNDLYEWDHVCNAFVDVNGQWHDFDDVFEDYIIHVYKK